MTAATQSTSAQIRLITTAQSHALHGRRVRVLEQLRDIRKITDRNARDVHETRGNTAESGSPRGGPRGLAGAGAALAHGKSNGVNGRGTTSARRIGIFTTDDRVGRHELGPVPRGDDRSCRRGRSAARWQRWFPISSPGPAPRGQRAALTRARRGSRAGVSQSPHPVLLPRRRRWRFAHMQQRVVIGALCEGSQTRRSDRHRRRRAPSRLLEREHALAGELRDASPDGAGARHRPPRVDGTGGRRRAARITRSGTIDWQVRRTAVKALADRRDPAPRRRAGLALRDRHRDFSVLSSALQLLTMTGVDVTAALDRSAAPPGRRPPDSGAPLALGTQDQPEAAAALLAARSTIADANVRFHAIDALGQARAAGGGGAAGGDRRSRATSSSRFRRSTRSRGSTIRRSRRASSPLLSDDTRRRPGRGGARPDRRRGRDRAAGRGARSAGRRGVEHRRRAGRDSSALRRDVRRRRADRGSRPPIASRGRREPR